MLTGIKEQVATLLESLPVCKRATNSEHWIVRCPFCGDSLKEDHGHLYIKIPEEENAPMVYRCVKCPDKTNGMVNKYLLNKLGFKLNAELTSKIAESNAGTPRKRVDLLNRNIIWYIPNYEFSISNMTKLNYINDRLGLDIKLSDCTRYKIVLSLTSFMVENKLILPHVKKGTIRELERKYVGFVSTGGNTIIFRDVTNSGYFGRYFKLTLDPKVSNPNSFYNTSQSFDLLYTTDIHIHIAEGVFDIISIMNNIKELPQNSLFYASCGYGFSNIMKYVIAMGVTTDIVIHIWGDNDKQKEVIIDSIRQLSTYQFIKKMNIYYNRYEGEKDFGVPENKIIVESERI